MRFKQLAVLALLPALLALLPVASPAAVTSIASDPALVWSYDDPSRDGVKAVDVLRTQLDMNVEGHYRIRVYGSDFIKNTTDIVRIYFDTDRPDGGPEYRLSWYLGQNPVRPVNRTSLYRVDYWEWGIHTKVQCPGMRHQVNYAKDTITLVIARQCVKNPDRLRWAGFVASITGVTEDGRFYSRQDQFPAYRTWPQEWVG